MPIYYHGTTSTREEWILKHGLKMSWGDGQEKKGRFVWMTPDFRVALHYARMRALFVRMPIGSSADFIMSCESGEDGELQFETVKIMKYLGTASPEEERMFHQNPKLGPAVDPSVRPVVLQLDLPENWRVMENPRRPGEWRIARNVTPSMLSTIRLSDAMEILTPEDYSKALNRASSFFQGWSVLG